MATGYQPTPEELAAVAENGSTRDKAAVASGRIVATGNQSLTNQGVRAGATQVPTPATPPAAAAPAAPPPKANAANSKNPSFTGLCEALNTHQRSLVPKIYEIADIYEIEFVLPEMAAAKVTKPGNTDYSATNMQQPTATGSQLNSATNSVETNTRSEPVQAGTQIVQFIDKVMRNSTYLSDQALYITDQVTGKQVPNANNKNGTMAWYKISVTATPLPGYDNLRHDHAYRMKFTISPYAINQIQSEYFPKAKFRGLHKNYNYWFSGQNMEILDFQQEYNNLYRVVMSGTNVPALTLQTSDPRMITRKTFMVASAQSSQGADKQANEVAANASDSLYSQSDQAKIKIKIVGDPAWLQQGEPAIGVSARTFNFAPFNADGCINYDAAQIAFAVSWNRPVDYNFNTGIADVTASNVQGSVAIGVTAGSQPQESSVYTAVKVRSSFSKGRFEQEIEGRQLVESLAALTAAAGTPNPAAKPTPPAPPAAATATATVPYTPATSVNDTRTSAGVDINGNFTGASDSPNQGAA